MSAIFQCANDNLGRIRNSWQPNFGWTCQIQRNNGKYTFYHCKDNSWKARSTIGSWGQFTVAGSNFLANTFSMTRKNPRREWEQIPSISPGALYSEALIIGDFFAVPIWGAYFRNFYGTRPMDRFCPEYWKTGTRRLALIFSTTVYKMWQFQI